MFDLTTTVVPVIISSVIQYGFYLILRRPLDRVKELETKIEDQIDGKLMSLEAGQKEDGTKRKAIYERLERIELTYRQTADCLRMHEDIKRMHEQSLDSVRRLEQVSTTAQGLVKRIDEIASEQISLGKDMADLSARMEERKP